MRRLGLWERPPRVPGRPRVLLNMVSTVDGRASVEGRSAPLSSPADRDLFHALRSAVDAILVGAGTARAERYGPLIPDAGRRAERERAGMPAEPLACVVSASLALGADLPLLAAPQARVALLTPSGGELEGAAARIEYVRCRRADGKLDLAGALEAVGERFGVGLMLCEGGPHLAGELLAGGLLDDLFLTLSPALAGEAGAGAGPELRILAGAELSQPVAVELLEVLEHGSQLFLHYRVAGSGRVSRETMPSSSPAR